MCGVSQLPSLQKWVTLQPNSDFNDHESCTIKETLDMRAIAREIALELDQESSGSRSQSGFGRNVGNNGSRGGVNVNNRGSSGGNARPSNNFNSRRNNNNNNRGRNNNNNRGRNNNNNNRRLVNGPSRARNNLLGSNSQSFRFEEGDAVNRPLPQESFRY